MNKNNLVSIYMMPATFNALELKPDQEVDLPTLMIIIQDCLRMNRDGRYTPEQRKGYLEKATKLTKQQNKLLGVYFKSGVDELKKANAAIKKVKDATNQALKDIEKTADTLEQLSALINSLTAVIGLIPKI